MRCKIHLITLQRSIGVALVYSTDHTDIGGIQSWWEPGDLCPFIWVRLGPWHARGGVIGCRGFDGLGWGREIERVEVCFGSRGGIGWWRSCQIVRRILAWEKDER